MNAVIPGAIVYRLDVNGIQRLLVVSVEQRHGIVWATALTLDGAPVVKPASELLTLDSAILRAENMLQGTRPKFWQSEIARIKGAFDWPKCWENYQAPQGQLGLKG